MYFLIKKLGGIKGAKYLIMEDDLSLGGGQKQYADHAS